MKFNRKQLTYLLLDMLIAFFIYYLAALLRYEGNIPSSELGRIGLNAVISTCLVPILSLTLGCYSGLWLYISFEAIFRQFVMSAIYALIFLVLKYVAFPYQSGSIAVIAGLLLFLCTTIIRGIPRFLRWCTVRSGAKRADCKRVVIVGAGGAGALIIKRLVNSKDEPIYPVAIVDDDADKQGMNICGVKIAGKINQIAAVCERYQAEEILIAILSAEGAIIKEIYNKCATTGLKIKIFQSVVDMENYFAGDKKALKEFSIEDLLFRDSVKSNRADAEAFIKHKRVMVTGGAGSIGSELCRQVLECGCEKLLIFDFNENGLFELNEEFKNTFDAEKYTLCLGSIRDRIRLHEVIADFQPEIVFHAAAHKHVPMMEINPFEAIKNNVIGTLHVITECLESGVKKFILISTDKAVNPTNIMGASKRLAELLVQSMNGLGCELAAVRFGNVLGSVGSVIPTFQKQIAAGGPVTVTDKEMQRYFMTIPEAVSLVLGAGALAKGGEVFVLDMGRPVKIYDLAKDLIRLSGLEPEKDIAIKITGLRKGEKMFEELALSSETVDKTAHDKIFVMHGLRCNIADLENCMDTIIRLTHEEQDEEALRKAVFDAVLEN